MGRPHSLLRAGFPFLKTLGMRRVTNMPMDMAVGDDGMVYVLNRIMCGDGLQPLGQIARLLWDDDGSWDLNERTPLGGVGTDDGQFIWPVCMIIDAAQVLFVSDEALHRITSLTTQG